ncbi:HNH endonuclease [Halorarius litoreus]|uniref:HNH endonuclease n=1 Tax=Halorarius litoreus TaxID=2962676 RepID=UPI0020CB8A58|nr:HNH endonuclease signature motif containing protein [Halorarius litoreus]
MELSRHYVMCGGMGDARIRSMVPLFGGGDSYVKTLDRTLQYIASAEPTHGELIEWHREQFANVESQGSIERRLRYLESLGFVQQGVDGWRLDTAGQRYFPEQDSKVLFDIMAERNVGLQSLLFELAARPMTIEEINAFLLSTNEVLGWTPTKTDMAKQRVNWLRSLDLVARQTNQYQVTTLGQQFVDEIQSIRGIWAEEAVESESNRETEYSATEYQSVTSSRALDPEFRAVVLHRYDTTCPVSTVDHSRLLDIAHVLPWSDYPDYRADFGNVLPLSKTHHAAFDAELFTLDTDYRLQVHPNFETESDLLQRTLLHRDGETLSAFANGHLDPTYLEMRNDSLGWW